LYVTAESSARVFTIMPAVHMLRSWRFERLVSLLVERRRT
jgi:hypothetical protein